MIQVGPLNERLRGLKGAKMVVDVVHCNSAAVSGLKKALQFVCGNAVVCETLREARSVAFDGPQRIKVSPPPRVMVQWNWSIVTYGSEHRTGSRPIRSAASMPSFCL